jgi:hypothetical protein
MFMQGNAKDSFRAILEAVQKFFSPSPPAKQASSDAKTGKYVGARTTVTHDENFDLTSDRIFIKGTNTEAKAKTFRTLLKPKAELGADGKIHYTQVVYSLTTFKVNSPQADVDAEMRRVDSVRAEVKELNSRAQTAALRNFSGPEQAESVIGKATQSEWSRFLLRDSTQFEIIGGGR